MISNCVLRKNKTVTYPLAEISEAREEEFTSSLSVGDGCYMVDLGKYVDLSCPLFVVENLQTTFYYLLKSSNYLNSHQPLRVCRRRRVHPAAAAVVPRMQQTVCRHETSRGTKSHGAPDLPPLWQLLRMDKPVRWRRRLLDGRHRTRHANAPRRPAGLPDGIVCGKSPASGRWWSRFYGDSDEQRRCSTSPRLLTRFPRTQNIFPQWEGKDIHLLLLFIKRGLSVSVCLRDKR